MTSLPVSAPRRPCRADSRSRSSGPITVVVDYAHTPDGLETALDSARRLASGHRVLCVFGCGGDRDHAKRPSMAEIATDRADVTVVTSDNPRHEDPAAIIDQVLAGASGPRSDRRARPAPGHLPGRRRGAEGDVVLVAGKGHEAYIEVRRQQDPFDDRDEVVAAVTRTRRARRRRRGSAPDDQPHGVGRTWPC